MNTEVNNTVAGPFKFLPQAQQPRAWNIMQVHRCQRTLYNAGDQPVGINTGEHHRWEYTVSALLPIRYRPNVDTTNTLFVPRTTILAA